MTGDGVLDKAACRALARERVEHLLTVLQAVPDAPPARTAIDLATHLGRAIDAFHMEAIRFRMFTLERLFASGTLVLPPEAHETLAQAKAALEAAGFHTRSVAH